MRKPSLSASLSKNGQTPLLAAVRRRAVDARRHTARLRSGRASTAARGAGLGRRRTGGTRGDGARGDVEPLGTCVKIDQRVRLSWELFASRYLGTAAMLPAELAPL